MFISFLFCFSQNKFKTKTKPREKELRKGINKCEEMIKQLEINSIITQSEINQLFNKMRSKLDEKEQELLNKLEEIERYKKKELEIQKEDLKFGIDSIIGSCQMIENSLALSNNNSKHDVQLLSMKKLYYSRLDYLLNNIWRIEPCHNPIIDFLIDKKEEELICSTILNIARVESNEILGHKCLISRNELQKIFKDEEFKFEIISFSKEGNEMKIGGNEKKFNINIERKSELKSENNGNNGNNEWEIADLNNGRYEVKMKLKGKGKYEIFIKYDGINLLSSSFQVEAFIRLKSRNYNKMGVPKLTFGSIGNEDGQFNGIYGVTTDSGGNIFVSEHENHRIQIFNSEGQFISRIGEKGNGNGQFNYPTGITLNSKGNILVSDALNHRIQIFDSEGNFISTFGSNGKENGQFDEPDGISVDLIDNIYVSDSHNNRVQVFDSEGKFLFTFGSEGDECGQFHNVCEIEINSKGNIIVSDVDNYRIQIFDSKGNFISTFGSFGKGNGQFESPVGICIDENDNILVCDNQNHRIQIFDSNGEYLAQLGMDSPLDITINPNSQDIIVCSANQISIF